ncbi:LytR/AlgR family response regulator transcription factor [Tenacibaculum sp. nBUS_03]|uniref:LytR/AlgR family response regulator transcription factor n=1 Tax=Tenacibaculum sp. nBUS_03 TaxID=3395320 RepID=UPI003EBA7F98
MKVIIIDDERKARNVLNTLIVENHSDITDVFQAEDLVSGVELIKKERPQIVFLDIEMPEYSGMEIIDFIDKEVYDFEIIFVTAYSEYAIKAFQMSAIDYLLKPVSPSQVKLAIEKACKKIGKGDLNEQLLELKRSFTELKFKKIALPFSDGIKFVSIDDIIFIEADGMYSKFFLKKLEVIMVSKPLKHFVPILEGVTNFFRSHRSFLINMNYIKEYIKKDGGYIVMDNEMVVSISNDKKQEFLSLISKI